MIDVSSLALHLELRALELLGDNPILHGCGHVTHDVGVVCARHSDTIRCVTCAEEHAVGHARDSACDQCGHPSDELVDVTGDLSRHTARHAVLAVDEYGGRRFVIEPSMTFWICRSCLRSAG